MMSPEKNGIDNCKIKNLPSSLIPSLANRTPTISRKSQQNLDFKRKGNFYDT